MDKYRPGDDVGPLEFWPFDSPESNYRVVAGDPKTYGRIERGGTGNTTRFGIWRCTEGAFSCTEQGNELMTVLAGRCRITWHDSGEVLELGPGDTIFILDGSRATWEVTDEITKVFFGHKPSGY